MTERPVFVVVQLNDLEWIKGAIDSLTFSLRQDAVLSLDKHRWVLSCIELIDNRLKELVHRSFKETDDA